MTIVETVATMPIRSQDAPRIVLVMGAGRSPKGSGGRTVGQMVGRRRLERRDRTRAILHRRRSPVNAMGKVGLMHHVKLSRWYNTSTRCRMSWSVPGWASRSQGANHGRVSYPRD